MSKLRKFICIALALFAALYAIATLHGCGLWGERAAGAVDIGAYVADLKECREEGKRRHSFAVYEQCAHETDIRHGYNLDGGTQ